LCSPAAVQNLLGDSFAQHSHPTGQDVSNGSKQSGARHGDDLLFDTHAKTDLLFDSKPQADSAQPVYMTHFTSTAKMVALGRRNCILRGESGITDRMRRKLVVG
jgi:hypothetical protein